MKISPYASHIFSQIDVIFEKSDIASHCGLQLDFVLKISQTYSLFILNRTVNLMASIEATQNSIED